MIVKRGPQLVQFIKGYPYRRVLFVPKLPQAVLADADIRGDKSVPKISSPAFADLKAGEILKLRGIADVHFFNQSEARRFFRNFRRETLQSLPLALQFKLNAGGGIFYKAAKLITSGQLMNKRTKANALHYSMYLNQSSFHRQSFSIVNLLSCNIISLSLYMCKIFFYHFLNLLILPTKNFFNYTSPGLIIQEK